MEKEINIADILRDKPKGTKLYDKLRGRTVSFDKIGTQYGTTICATYCNSFFTYKPNGKYDVSTEDGIQILVPSKEMQDWSKFAWKKGDVLKVAIGSGCSCIFDRFTNDDYTEFTGVFDKYLDRFDHFATSDWCKVTDRKEYKSIIQRIEAQFGGKLNLSTLEIKKQPEFKPMDWCLMRRDFSRWELCQFSWKCDGLYHSVGGCLFHQCIPYNDQTAHLLGTTDNYE